MMTTAAVAQMSDPSPASFYISATGMHVSDADSDLENTVSGDIGGVIDGEFTNGIGGLLAIGYGRRSGPRGELEIGYRKVDAVYGGAFSDGSTEVLGVGEGDMKTLTLMANGIYSMELGTVRTYIGGGAGVARQELTYGDGVVAGLGQVVPEEAKETDTDNVFAYQAMAGVEFPMSDRVDARLGYRYFRTADADMDGADVGYAMHNFEAGLLVRF